MSEWVSQSNVEQHGGGATLAGVERWEANGFIQQCSGFPVVSLFSCTCHMYSCDVMA